MLNSFLCRRFRMVNDWILRWTQFIVNIFINTLLLIVEFFNCNYWRIYIPHKIWSYSSIFWFLQSKCTIYSKKWCELFITVINSSFVIIHSSSSLSLMDFVGGWMSTYLLIPLKKFSCSMSVIQYNNLQLLTMVILRLMDIAMR